MVRDVDVALKVAVLLNLVPRGEIAARAGATEAEVKTAIALRRVAPYLEREEDRPTL